MNPLSLPWLDLAVLAPLLGAVLVVRADGPAAAARRCLAFSGFAFGCTFLTWLGRYAGFPAAGWGLVPDLSGRPLLAADGLSAPLLAAVALLHFLTALATPRTKMVRFSFAGMLFGESLCLATFACMQPWLLVGLLAATTVPPYLELRQRRRPTRVYVLHMALFVALLVVGWACVAGDPAGWSPWAMVPLLAAILVRSGTVPAHCWLTDLFEHASFGTALLVVTPITGVYAAVRLILPAAPDWALQAIGLASLVTAVYAAGMALVQREARRFFAYLFLSHASLVLVGLELHTSISLTGALCLWFSVVLALGGLGLTLRALEARFGRLALDDYHGLYEHTPTLAVCFLLLGLASVGFPGTLGFVSTELLVDGAVEASPYLGLAVVLTSALNGIAIVRAYFLLFTGSRHVSSAPLQITPRERFAVLTLAGLILGGGVHPQPGVAACAGAAATVLKDRQARLSDFPAGSRLLAPGSASARSSQ